MKKKICLLTGLTLVATSAAALDLFATYQRALAYNADYLKAIALSAAGQEQPNIARAQLFPQITGTLSYSENYFDQGGITAYYHQPVYGASLNQVVFDFSKFSAYTKGKFAAELASLQEDEARQLLMVNVAQAYFDVLYAEDTLLATQMTKTALEQQLVQAKSAFQVGSVTIADVNDAQAGFDAASAQEIQDENNVIYKKNIFRNLTGVDPEQIQPLQTATNLTLPQPSDPQAWSQLAKTGNLDVQIATKQVSMAQQDIKISRAGHLPTVTLNAQYQYQDTGGLDVSNASPQQLQPLVGTPGSPLSSYSVGSIGLQVSVPIFSGGGVSAQVRQAVGNYESAQMQLLKIDRQTDQGVQNAYWQVQNGVSIVKAQKAALLSAKTKLDSDKLGYQVGVRNSVDLVGSQKNYYQTFQSYQQSRYQYLLAQVQLQYLSGLINDKFLQQLNANIKN